MHYSDEDQIGRELFQQELEKNILLYPYVGRCPKCILVTDAFCLPEQAMVAIKIKTGHKVPSVISLKLMNLRENLL